MNMILVECEMFISYLVGDVEEIVGYIGLEFKEGVRFINMK